MAEEDTKDLIVDMSENTDMQNDAMTQAKKAVDELKVTLKSKFDGSQLFNILINYRLKVK
jgi:hypothetical protein